MSKPLHVYLDDHWAGAGGGSALARRLAEHNRSTRWASELDDIACDIEEDQRFLAEVRARHNADGGDLKRSIAQVGERVRLLKTNKWGIRYTTLSRLLEAEALIAGVAGKQRLWASLLQAPDTSPGERVRIEEMHARAAEQIARLEPFHEWAAAEAFSETT